MNTLDRAIEKYDLSYRHETLPVSIKFSVFKGESGIEEFHLIVSPVKCDTFENQLFWVTEAYVEAVESLELERETAIFRRFTCSDIVNQADVLRDNPLSNPDYENECAISWICQVPAMPAKISMWAYHINDSENGICKEKGGSTLSLKREELKHHWTTGLSGTGKENSYEQSVEIFLHYNEFLRSKGMTLEANTVRTWFFVRNIDFNYRGMVTARNESFEENGLTAETHYIASTGIEGGAEDVKQHVLLDAYAIEGLRAEQIQYLKAPDYLSPTHIYGVAFERGTAVSYRDRKQVIISGTASIDADGRILYGGDVSRQFDRTVINMEALLCEAGADLEDLRMIMVYIRNPNDQEIMRSKVDKVFKNTPYEIVVAPVCRPGWLVEIEGIATIPNNNPKLPAF